MKAKTLHQFHVFCGISPLRVRPLGFGVSVLIFVVQLGHAAVNEAASRPLPLSERARADLGTIGVMAPSTPAEFGFDQSSGRKRSAADGAEKAGQAIMELGLVGNPLPELHVAAIALTPIAALAGAIGATAQKLPAGELADSEADLSRAMAECADQRKMRDCFLRVAREKTRRPFAVCNRAAAGLGTNLDNQPLLDEGIDTALEITVQDIRLRRAAASDASFALFVNARALLVRVTDGVVLYDNSFPYRSGTCLFLDWTLNKAEPFRAQMDTAYRILAERILDQLFLSPAVEIQTGRLASSKKPQRPGQPQVLYAGHVTPRSSNAVSPLSDEFRARLGTIGLISTSTIPKFSMQKPLIKRKAAVETGQQFASLGDDERAGVWVLGTAGFGLPLIPASGIVGNVVGAAKGVPLAKFAQADRVLSQAVFESNLQEGLRKQILRHAQERTARSIVLVQKPFPAGAEQEFRQMACVMAGTLAWLPRGQSARDYLANQGIDTILEIQLLHPGLKGKGGINPSLALCVEVRASLLRVRDGAELYSFPVKYRSRPRKFTTWAANSAGPFREELERCYQTVSERIADQLFAQPEGALPVRLAQSGRN